MPELPEVETVRRGLEPLLKNAVIDKVTLKRADLRFPFPHKFAHRLKGLSITGIDRRGKYLLFNLSNHHTLLAHLGMSGRFRVEANTRPSDSPERQRMAASKSERRNSFDPGLFYDETTQSEAHDHVVIDLSGGRRLIYNDARRFGFMELLSADETVTRFAAMGLEPLSPKLNGAALAQALDGKTVAIKPALLDQCVIAGIGNIYACEALFDTSIDPRAPAGSLGPDMAKALAASLKKVLKKAIRLGGSTLRDFKDAAGKSGAFQHEFLVYDRAGKPCLRCGHEIERFAQTGRSTFWCPNCQTGLQGATRQPKGKAKTGACR